MEAPMKAKGKKMAYRGGYDMFDSVVSKEERMRQ